MDMTGFGLTIILIRLLINQGHSDEMIEKVLSNLQSQSEVERIMTLCSENPEMDSENLLKKINQIKAEC